MSMQNKQKPEEFISAQDTREMQEEASLTIVDTRSPEEYAERHVVGAINIPFDLLEEKLDRLPKDHPVITYCSMKRRGQSRSEKAAAQLRSTGYDARVLEGGLPAWEQAGFATSQGTE